MGDILKTGQSLLLLENEWTSPNTHGHKLFIIIRKMAS